VNSEDPSTCVGNSLVCGIPEFPLYIYIYVESERCQIIHTYLNKKKKYLSYLQPWVFLSQVDLLIASSLDPFSVQEVVMTPLYCRHLHYIQRRLPHPHFNSSSCY
jgi:hypothetical protein